MHTKYGQSVHYESLAGEAYFSYQNKFGPISGRLNAFKFRGLIKEADHILDFGCGGGWLLKELPGALKFGVEPNPAARNSCVTMGVNVVETVAALPTDIVFDLIISHHALEHVPYPIEALRELRTKLKPGGKLVLVLPVDDWRTQKDFSGEDIDHHLHTWTPRLLANTLAEAGFKATRVEILTDAWPPRVATLFRLPRPIFRMISYCWSVLRRRRQLFAIAQPRQLGS